ncbi:MAG: hypothetical protein JNM56_25100 [Planctomycetia bacterium]|nr:hypothetical protein [Planctomycetia bacterium]
MSWEHRNGRLYYTRSRRQAGRIVREYIGTGPVAEAAAQADAQRRAARLNQRELEHAERSAWTAAEAAARTATDLVTQLFRASLLGASFRLHARSEWRRRKDAHDHNDAD